jgi:hypothetical protein
MEDDALTELAEQHTMEDDALTELAEQQQRDRPYAVRIDLAAVWQPLLQVVLQLPLTAAAAGASKAGVSRGCLTRILTNGLDVCWCVLRMAPPLLLTRPAGRSDERKAAVRAFWLELGCEVLPFMLGRLAPLVLQQLRRSAREAKRAGAVLDSSGSSSSSSMSSAAGDGSGDRSEAGMGSSRDSGSTVADSSGSSSSSSSSSSAAEYLVDSWARAVGELIQDGGEGTTSLW